MGGLMSERTIPHEIIEDLKELDDKNQFNLMTDKIKNDSLIEMLEEYKKNKHLDKQRLCLKRLIQRKLYAFCNCLAFYYHNVGTDDKMVIIYHKYYADGNPMKGYDSHFITSCISLVRFYLHENK